MKAVFVIFVSRFDILLLTFCSCEKNLQWILKISPNFHNNFVKNLGKEEKMQPARMFVQRLANMTGNFPWRPLPITIKSKNNFSCYVTYLR